MEIIEINENAWTERQGLSSTGKRVKAWYERNSDDKIFLYKTPKIYKETKQVTFELSTEIIAYHIGKNLRLDIPAIYPAKEKDTYGVLIESFLSPNEELREAKDILQKFEIKPSHNISLIELLLKKIDNSLYIWNQYKQMLIFDCLIGNNDRHDENWGLCVDFNNKKVRFAPIYDNASCLAKELTEERVVNILNDEKAFLKYINNSKPPNLFWNEMDAKRYRHFELIKKLIDKEPETKQIIEEFLQINYILVVDDIIKKIQNLELPEEHKLSDNRVKAIFKILESRRAKLQELL